MYMLSLWAAVAAGSVVINEVSDRGSLSTCDGGDWVEIANTGAGTEDLTNWKLCDSDGCTDDDAITLTGTIGAGAYKTFCGTAEQPRFIGASDVIELYDAAGAVVDTSGTLGGDGAFGKTWSRQPDLSGSFAYSYVPTPGASNGPPGTAPTSDVVVNEVSDKGTGWSTCAGADWVELYNKGSASVDLSDYMLCDERGCDETDSYTFPTSISIAGGDFMLICGQGVSNGFTFGIGGRDLIGLHSPSGIPLSSSGNLPGGGEYGKSYARSPDGTGDFVSTYAPTPGAAFNGLGTSGLAALQAIYDEAESFFGVTSMGESVAGVSTLVDIRLSMSEAATTYMWANSTFEQYVPANLTYDGVTLPSPVGIRPRGFSSLAIAECMGVKKMPFQLDINKYQAQQTFFGVKKVFLRGGISDPSSIRDWYGHRLLAKFGLPHLRSRYIQLYINDELIGLYLAMEAWDSEPLIAKLIPNYNASDYQMYKHKVGAGGLLCTEMSSLSTSELEASLQCTDQNQALKDAAYANDGTVLPRGCPDIPYWLCPQVASLCPLHCGECEEGDPLRDTADDQLVWNRGQYHSITRNLYAEGVRGEDLVGQCSAQFFGKASAIAEDRRASYLKHNQDCAEMMLESRALDYEIGRKKSLGNARMTAFINMLNSANAKTATMMAQYVDVDNWLKTLAWYAVVIAPDSPTMNYNNFFLIDPGDGSGYKIGVWDLDGIAQDGVLAILCGAECNGRAVSFSVARPTCNSDNQFFKPFLDDPFYFNQYVNHVNDFQCLYASESFRNEVVDIGQDIKNAFKNDGLVQRMLEDSGISANDYAEFTLPPASTINSLVAGTPTATTELAPPAAFLGWRGANVANQLAYIDSNGKYSQSAKCPVGETASGFTTCSTEPLGSAKVSASFKASGAVSDFSDPTVQDSIKAPIAVAAGVDISAVTLIIVSASVLITAEITVLDTATASATAAVLDSGIFASQAALQSALGAAITVEEVYSVEGPSDNEKESDNIGLIIGAAAGGVAVVITVAILAHCAMKRKVQRGKATKAVGSSSTSASISASSEA